MRVENLCPMGTGSVIARFDLALTPDAKIFGMLLKRTGSGYRVFPPNAGGRAMASLAPDFAADVTRAAVAAMEGGRLDARAA